ncbi:hypothetical protein ACGFK1_11515 [Mycobacterium sp. NPDC048908]
MLFVDQGARGGQIADEHQQHGAQLVSTDIPVPKTPNATRRSGTPVA